VSRIIKRQVSTVTEIARFSDLAVLTKSLLSLLSSYYIFISPDRGSEKIQRHTHRHTLIGHIHVEIFVLLCTGRDGMVQKFHVRRLPNFICQGFSLPLPSVSKQKCYSPSCAYWWNHETKKISALQTALMNNDVLRQKCLTYAT